VVVHDIDVLNMTRVINGVDRLAAIRSAIGL
jgi:phage tail tube protein FII